MLRGGDVAGAVAALRALLAGGDTRVSVVHDLARAHFVGGDQATAISLMRRLVDAAPDRADIRLHLVAMLDRAGRFAESRAECAAALVRWPDDVHLWRRSEWLAQLGGDRNGAILALTQQCRLAPDDPAPWRRLALAASDAEEVEVAGSAFERWLTLTPHDPIAIHLHRAFHHDGAAHPVAGYVAKLFDSYAASFDDHLAELGYRTPGELADLASGLVPGGFKSVADLGCGTGQMGAALREMSATLVGVDLSAAMIAKAAERGCYDALVVDDLVGFLTERPRSFDLLVAADCFIYDGDLRPAFRAARLALGPSGWLLFSLESGAEHHGLAYHLERTGRYTHATTWAVVALAAAGFDDIVAHPTILRMEAGRPVEGVLVQARCGPE